MALFFPTLGCERRAVMRSTEGQKVSFSERTEPNLGSRGAHEIIFRMKPPASKLADINTIDTGS